MEAWSLASVPVLPRSRRARAALAVLALAPAGTAVTRQRLAALLWSRRGEEQRRGSLRQALHELRLALEPIGTQVLEATRDTVRLRADQVWVDALELVRGDDPGLRAGLAPPAEGLLLDLEGLDPAFDGWLALQRRRMREAMAALPRPTEPGRGPPTPPPATEAPPPDPAAGTDAATTASLPRPARRGRRGARLGVLPLRVLGGSEAEAHLGAALAEEITAALARFRWMFVVDHASLSTASAREGEMKAARGLGLDFLLSGTIQSSPATRRVRITLRLTDPRQDPAGVVWSGRFQREADDLLALQDAVAAEVVAQVDPEILMIEADRAAGGQGRQTGAVSASAYDLLLRAMPGIHRLDREGFLAAGALLREAIAREPDYAAPHAWLAYWHMFLVGQGWAEDSAEILEETERLAARAVTLDPLDAQALTILGHTRAFLRHRLEDAQALHDRALALNPNLAMAWVFAGMALSYLGQHGAAMGRVERYRQLAPCHPHAFFFDAARGIPLLFLRRHEEAVEVGRAATALQPQFSYPYKTYLAALGHLGFAEEAAEVRARLLAIEPDFTVAKALRRTPVRQEVDRAHYAQGLRRAGLR